METAISKPRRPWLAALLSLLGGPVGQVYAGHLRRSILLWCFGALLLPILAFSVVCLPALGRAGLAMLLLCMLAFPVYLAGDAFIVARRNRYSPRKWYQRWWMYLLLYFLFLAANLGVAHGVRAFIAEGFVVPTRSMSPTIHAGDRILVDKLWSDSGRLCRGDVVVFRSRDPGAELHVTRVAGLPGDEIQITNERVLINGIAWGDEHAVFDGPLPEYIDLANFGPLKVPADCFFVLGDNRRLSRDSRVRGPIPLSDFYGKARLVYWSQVREFPDPYDVTRYHLGPIRWDRIGARLD